MKGKEGDGEEKGCVKQKLQFTQQPLEAGSETESVPRHFHVKIPNFKEQINIFTVWHSTVLVTIAIVRNL